MKGGSRTTAEVALPAACLTDVGHGRDHNEDSFGENPKLGLWIVADGVGGHAAGEVASDLAVSRIMRLVGEGRPVSEAVSETHDIIRRAPSEGIGSAGMASTVVVAQLTGSSYRVFWVGDSRAYVHGSEGLQLITVDHSYVQELLDSGVITPEEAEVHPERNIVTRCLGWDGHSSVEVSEVAGELHQGEVILLCTDGLTGEVADADIAAVLREEAPLAERAQRLVDKANANGGSDNITVALIPAPADAPQQPDVVPTREIPSLGTGEVRAVRKRRRTRRWSSAAVAIFAVGALAWFSRERVVELAPTVMSHLREAVSSLWDQSEPAPDSSPLDAPQSDADSGEAGESGGEDPAPEDAPSDEMESSPLNPENPGDVPEDAKDPDPDSSAL